MKQPSAEGQDEIAELHRLVDNYAELLGKSQDILAEHLEPGGPNAETTLSTLIDLLDGPQWRQADDLRSRLRGSPRQPFDQAPEQQ